MIDGLDDGYIWWDDGDGLLMSWIIVSKIDRECEVIHIRSKIYISCCCLNPPNDVDDYDDDHHTNIVCHYYKFVFICAARTTSHTNTQPTIPIITQAARFKQSGQEIFVFNIYINVYAYMQTRYIRDVYMDRTTNQSWKYLQIWCAEPELFQRLKWIKPLCAVKGGKGMGEVAII